MVVAAITGDISRNPGHEAKVAGPPHVSVHVGTIQAAGKKWAVVDLRDTDK